MPVGTIESLDHEARGITRHEGKVIFVEDALPGEVVEYTTHRKKPAYELAHMVRVLKASPARTPPPCPHFGLCGGCSMQHLSPESQVAVKQRLLEDNLRHIAKVRPAQLFSPIYGQASGYRHRARVSVRLVQRKGGVLVGFHERRSSFIADMGQCQNLPPAVSALLLPLRALVGSLSIRERVPQIEIAVGERCTALVLRHLEPLGAGDDQRLREFADAHQIVWYLQAKGPDTVYRFYPESAAPLSYTLPDFGLELFFSPTEFTQVNPGVNRVMIRRAMALLAPQPGQRIADMFCGLGNFTLPIARHGAQVTGIEGSAALVQRAAQNAASNGLAEQCEFAVANLFEASPASLAALGPFDSMLIDPPREGAAELVKSLDDPTLQRIVYVSCNPSTLARDTAILVHEKGFRLAGAGVVNMFPNTSHVESIALFLR